MFGARGIVYSNWWSYTIHSNPAITGLSDNTGLALLLPKPIKKQYFTTPAREGMVQ